MTANNTGTQSIDSEEIASAKEVILTLVKASKMTRLYLPNSPTYGEFLHKYEYKMLGHLKEYGDLQLLVDKFTPFL